MKRRIALEACPGFGSCGGMFTYNTMQTFIGVVGMQPLHMVSPASQDDRRLTEFPDQLIDCLDNMVAKDIKPRDIVTNESIRNAIIVAMAVGGSTNVMLHAPEIARAAGYQFLRRCDERRGIQPSVEQCRAGDCRCAPVRPVLDG